MGNATTAAVKVTSDDSNEECIPGVKIMFKDSMPVRRWFDTKTYTMTIREAGAEQRALINGKILNSPLQFLQNFGYDGYYVTEVTNCDCRRT